MQTNKGAQYFRQKYEASEVTLTMKTMEKSQKANVLGLHIQLEPRGNSSTKMLNRAIKTINPTF